MNLPPADVIKAHNAVTALVTRAFELASRLGKTYGIHYFPISVVALTRVGDKWGLYFHEESNLKPLPNQRLNDKLAFLHLGVEKFFRGYLEHVKEVYKEMVEYTAGAEAGMDWLEEAVDKEISTEPKK
jgi:hypothetical protein